MKLTQQLIIALTLFCSCKSNQNDLLSEKTIKSLATSNQFIKSNSEVLYKSLEEKAQNNITKQAALMWIEKTRNLKFKTNSLIKYVDAINKDPKHKFDNLNVILRDHGDYLKGIFDSDLKVNLIDSILSEFKQTSNEQFLKKNKLKENIIKIELLKNSILLAENKVIEFANNRSMPGCILEFEVFKTIVSQNAFHFEKGDKLEITAGVGSFSVASSPIFIFDDTIKLKPSEGISIYSKQITNSPGKYKVPFTIFYINVDGEKKKFESDIEYEVH